MVAVEGKVLNPPDLAFGTPAKPFSDYENRKVPHAEPINLRKETWHVVYGEKAADNCDRAIKEMRSAGKAFNIIVEDPDYIEVPDHLVRKGQGHGFVEALKGDIEDRGVSSLIVLVILDQRHKYRAIKSYLDKLGIPSQVFLESTIGRAKPTVYSNVLK
jgi:hypothetical protein